MKANELRIGNWVEANSPAMQVVAINRHEIDLYMPGSEADPYTEDIQNIRPIPFTHKIYEIIKNNFGHDNNLDFAILFKENEFWMDGECVSMKRKGIVRIDYLHQAQNVWFALTNTELEYNPTNQE